MMHYHCMSDRMSYEEAKELKMKIPLEFQKYFIVMKHNENNEEIDNL